MKWYRSRARPIAAPPNRYLDLTLGGARAALTSGATHPAPPLLGAAHPASPLSERVPAIRAQVRSLMRFFNRVRVRARRRVPFADALWQVRAHLLSWRKGMFHVKHLF